MTFPAAYERSKDFSLDASDETAHADLNTELDNLGATLNALMTSVQAIQRDDTNLANGVVGVNALATEVVLLITDNGVTVRGDWVSGTDYAVGDLVSYDDGGGDGPLPYICDTAHEAQDVPTTGNEWIPLAPTSSLVTTAFTENFLAQSGQGTALQALGVDAAGRTMLFNSDTIADILYYLGFSTFFQTIIDEPDATSVLEIIGAARNDFSGAGDLLTTDASSTPIRLAKGTAGQALISNGTILAWGRPNHTVSISEASDATHRSITAQIPVDDTIPQDTEGTQVATVTHTANHLSNKIHVRVSVPVVLSAAGTVTVALFDSAASDAIAAGLFSLNGGSGGETLVLEWSGTRSQLATTFNVRVGPGSGITAYVCGNASGRLLGGVMAARIQVTEAYENFTA